MIVHYPLLANMMTQTEINIEINLIFQIIQM